MAIWLNQTQSCAASELPLGQAARLQEGAAELTRPSVALLHLVCKKEKAFSRPQTPFPPLF